MTIRRYKKGVHYLFVDGYNIMNQFSNLKSLMELDLEQAREKTMDMMAEFASSTGEYVILVFDGYLVKKSPGSNFMYKGIEVVFTKEFVTADHYIERELDRIGRLRDVRVATSDNIEQQMILSRGGIRLSARELEAEIVNERLKTKRHQRMLKQEKLNSMGDNLEILKKLREDYGER